MSTGGSVTRYVHALRSPDSQLRDEAARVIFERFAPRLKLLVRRHLDNRILRREDEQDILQAMFASFYQGQAEGRSAPGSRHELWKLLVRITMCKVVNTAHRHMAERRDVRRERPEHHHDPDDSRFPQWMLDHVDRAQPTAEEQVLVVDEIRRLIQSLDDDRLRQIVVWKLEGFTNKEISLMMGKTVRSVEMKLQLIRKLLEQEFRPPGTGRGRAPSGGEPSEGPAPAPDA